MTDEKPVPDDCKILLCEICRRPIVTKATNEWAAHWGCVLHGKQKEPEGSSDTRG